MKPARVLALLLAALSWLSIGQSQTHYKSQQSGSWNDPLTWEWGDGESWSQASSPPSGSENIKIQYGHTVTLSQSLTVKNTTIDSGGELVVSGGAVLTVQAGTGGPSSVRAKAPVVAITALRARSSSSGLRVYGTLTIKGGISASEAAVSLYGYSSVVYSGSSHQTIVPLLYYNLQLDNPAGASLSDNTTVDGNLNVTRGNLTTGPYTFTLDSFGSISETAPYAVLGILYTSRSCTTGFNQNFGGLGIEINKSAGSSPVGVTVTRRTGTPSEITGATSTLRYFDISVPGSGHGATVVFHYATNELNGANEAGLRLYKSSDGGSSWSSQGGAVSTSSHSITLSGVNSFSRWTAASVVPLPTLTNVLPSSGSAGSTLNLTLTGTNFGYGTNAVSFSGTGITVNSVTVNSSTQITANVTIGSSATTGLRDVSVSTFYGSATLPGSFTVGNPTPILTNVLPDSGNRGQSLPVTLQGNGFVSGVTSVSFGDSVTVSSVAVDGSTSLTSQIAIARGASLGARSVSVTNSAPGGGTVTLPNAFTVNNPAPTLSSVLPSSGIRGTTLPVTLQGTGFFGGITTVSFGDSISVSSVTVVSPTTLTAQITIATGAIPVARGISVSNPAPGGGTGTLPLSFTVTNPAPTISSVVPTSSLSGQTLTLSVTGTNFFAGQTSVSFGAGITVNSTTVSSSTQLSVTVSISSMATGGPRDVTVTNASPGGGSATLAGGFTVINPPPTLASLSATSGARGNTVGLLVTGSGFVRGVTTMSFGSGVTVTSLNVSNSSQLFVDLSIARDAALGFRDVTVTNALPGGGTQIQSSAFEVLNPPPTLTSVLPASGNPGQTLSVTLGGSDFFDGVSTVSFGPGVTVNSATVNSAGTQIAAGITIGATATPGARNVTVTNPIPGGGTATLTGGFSITSPAPTVTSIVPPTGALGQTLNVVIGGTNFFVGITSVNLGAGVTVDTVTVNSLTQMTVNITIAPGATIGSRDVTVTNGGLGGGTASLPAAFSVVNPAPTITSVTPPSAMSGQSVTLTIAGTNFVSGVTTVNCGAGITVNTVTVSSSTQLIAAILISSSAIGGSRDVTVTNPLPGGGSAVLTGGFRVNNPAPTLVSLSVASGFRGRTLSLQVNGTNFVDGVTTISMGAGITINTVTVSSASQLFVDIAIARDAALGFRDVTVTNASPGGGTQTRLAAFEVVNPPPALTSVLPASGNPGQTLSVTLGGSDFFDGISTVSFGDGVTVNTATVNTAGTQITAGITIGATATPGARNVTVTNPAPGGGTSTLSGAFSVVNPAPTITSVTPSSAVSGQTVSLTIVGTNFVSGVTTVSFGPGITVNTLTVNSPTQMSVAISISSSAIGGSRDVTVTNPLPGGGTAMLTGGFTVNNPAPTVTSIVPPTGALGQTLNVVIGGANFFAGITSVKLGAGVTVNTATVNSLTQMTANITIAPGATIGSRDVTVTNVGLGGGTANLPAAFSVVNPAPTITSVTPPSAASGQTVTLTIAGANFMSGQTSVSVGAGITVNTVTVNSPTQLSAAVSISSSAIGGSRDVTVTNPVPGGGTAVLTGGFTVNNLVPTITSVVPGSGARGKLVNVTITGSGFVPGVTSALPVAGMTLVSVTFVSTTQILGSFLVARDAAMGSRDITITNSGPGGGSATLARAFEVQNPSPTVLSVSPNTGDIGQSLSVVVTGTDFLNGVSSIDFGIGVTAGAVTIDTAGTHLTAGITIGATTTSGARNVTVTNSGPGGGLSTLPNAFTVANLVPTLTSLSTYAAGRGQTLNVTMTGTNFATGVTTASFGTGITVNSLAISSPTSAIANITIAATAATGARTVSVTNAPPGGGTATLASVFNVTNPAPTLSTVAPASGARGQTLDVIITGTGFISGTSALTLGSDITVNSFTVTSFTQINANITIASAGAAGGRDITVTNGPPGGGSGLLAAGFTVNNPAPTISNVSPASANRGSIVNVTVTGSQFITGVTSLNFGGDVVVNSIAIKSPTEILANITLSSLAASGSRTVTVTNASPGGGSANLPAGFTVGTGIATSVEGNMGQIPDQFVLQEAYPNPFNPSTRIRYGVPEDSRVRIVIHNMLGNIIAELVNGERTKGTYEMQWHADYLPSGVYLIRMYAESLESTKKFVASRKAVFVK